MNQLTTELRAVAKALVAGLATAIATAIGIAGDGIDLTDALILAGAFLAGAAPTWVVPNGAPPKTRNDDGNLEPGSAAIGLVVGLLVAYLILR